MDIPFPPTDATDQTTLLQLRLWTIPVLVLLSVLAIGLTVLCLSFGYTIVFQNLYYLPIILVCIYYPKRGMFFTTCISAVYALLVLTITRDASLLPPVLVRLVFFELVAAVMVNLCAQRAEAEAALKAERDTLSKKIAAQDDYIHTELEKSQRLANTYREMNQHEQMLFNRLEVPLLVLNPDLYIIRVNEAFTKLAGRQEADLVGRKLATLPLLEEASKKPYGTAVEISLPDAEGILHRALWSFSAIGEQGETGMAGTVVLGMRLDGTREGSKQNG